MNDDMKTSRKGLTFISRWEGCILKPYKDVAGIWTIGCGHVIKPGEKFDSITFDQAMDLLSGDVAIAEAGIKKCVSVVLNQNQFDALCSFTFNTGTGALAKSTLLVKLNNSDFAGAAEEFLKWCKIKDPKTSNLITNQGLLNRRQSEKELFLEPVTEQTNVSSLSDAEKAQVEGWIASSAQSSVDDVMNDLRSKATSEENDNC